MKLNLRYISYIFISVSVLIFFIRTNFPILNQLWVKWLMIILFLLGGILYFISYTWLKEELQKKEGQFPLGNMIWTIGGLSVILGSIAYTVGYDYAIYLIGIGFILAIIGWILSLTVKTENDDEDLLEN